ncbi:PP2C family protein-serine/threonine phosphatase [Ornithinimicrobium sufpigmenti]|uniref:PP2C family protein-serine/threonine phosphatase n=1 Tax=Ornithinimicrobium sufpigmenti TaxID=2508882 RepID=UPI0010355C0C|nr:MULTISPECIES: protein phosphatase 2C domain-containing protein [unclassified Ornithinimicrobium]
MPVALRYAARSNVGLGSKSRNEDSAYAGPELLVLCDGMGGHAAGDVASSLVVGELVHLDGEAHGADDSLDILERAIEEANSRLADVMEVYPDSDGMGTTCIAMMRAGTKLAVANIGDSRAYLLRGGRLTQITKDHSFVQQLLDEERINADEALHHPQRSLVTRVLTGRPEDQPDLSLRELHRGDRLMICSDGLTDYVSTDTVAEILGEADRTPGEIAESLIQTALRASTRDNVTVIVAEAVPAGDGTTKPQVVGAASERRGVQRVSALTPAEKAAELSREASGVPAAVEPPVLAEEQTSRLARVLRGSLVALSVVAVLAVAVWGGWTWSQQQYYVGEQDGQVAIFRGLSQDLGPIPLSTVEEESDVAVDALPAYYRDQVRRTLSADDRAGADRIVADLRDLLTGPEPTRADGRPGAQGCTPLVLLPDGSTTTAVPADVEAVTVASVEEGREELASGPLTEALLDRLGLGAGTLGGAAGTPAPTGAPTGATRPTTVAVVWPEDCP